MFTGIVEETGEIKRVRRGERSIALEISAAIVLEGLKRGDSVSVNGACLTVTTFNNTLCCADVMPETMRCSNLGLLQPGGYVNLERALTLSSRLDGHIVSGHIDGTGDITAIERDDNSVIITISAPITILQYIVEKGSVAVDGISLTVISVDNNSFKVSVIPHTQGITTLTRKEAGESVNLENDMIAKYIEKFSSPILNQNNDQKGVSLDFLMKHGF